MSILAPGMAGLWNVIESYGIDPRPLFLAEGIEVRLPIQAGSRVPYDKIDRIRARAAELSGDPAFGLRLAQFQHPSHQGALGYAWLACATLRKSLECLARYVRVLNDQGHINLRDEADTLVVEISVAEGSENARARDDANLAALVALCRINCGAGFRPAWIGSPHGQPQDLAPYRELFGCPLEFGTRVNTFVVLAADADRPLPSANPVLEQVHERMVARRLAQLDQADTAGRARAAIMDQLPTGKVSDETVAAALHITARTLHRRLKAQDQSFRGLLQAVRRDLAVQYIRDDSLTLTEITFLLGFSEMSSFSRAFKQWNGVSPSQARQAAH